MQITSRIFVLCNTIYKVITKIIVNCIKPFLDSLIGPFQSSFLKGRRASDNAIIIQEIIHPYNKLKGSNGKLLLKIDLKKDFDRLEWSFICRALNNYKFSSRITKLIMSCITTSRIAVLVNGSQTEFFKPSSGMRQGDPMSPYIFVY